MGHLRYACHSCAIGFTRSGSAVGKVRLATPGGTWTGPTDFAIALAPSSAIRVANAALGCLFIILWLTMRIVPGPHALAAPRPPLPAADTPSQSHGRHEVLC